MERCHRLWETGRLIALESSLGLIQRMLDSPREMLQERRPAKKREFDWKVRLQRGNDEKTVKAAWHVWVVFIIGQLSAGVCVWVALASCGEAKVGAISNRKVDRDHMRAWKAVMEKCNRDISQDVILQDLQDIKEKVAVLKQQLPSTGTPRSTPRSDPAPPSDAPASDGQRCDSEPKDTPSGNSGNRSEVSTPAESGEGAEKEQKPRESEWLLYQRLLDPQLLRRNI